MPRLSKTQWDEVRRRRIEGEGVRDLALEFGISPSAISKMLRDELESMNAIAMKVVDAEKQFEKLTPSQQKFTDQIIVNLRKISDNLAMSAVASSETGRELAFLALSQVNKIDQDDPMNSQETLQAISALTKMSNEANTVPLALINANRGNKAPDPTNDTNAPKALADFYGERA
jgi:DNA-binding MarR family transcriptional regulator